MTVLVLLVLVGSAHLHGMLQSHARESGLEEYGQGFHADDESIADIKTMIKTDLGQVDFHIIQQGIIF
jgi:hypothetical protein